MSDPTYDWEIDCDPEGTNEGADYDGFERDDEDDDTDDDE